MSFLTNIDWSNPTTIGISIGVVVAVAIVGYLVWAYTENKPPFN